MKKIHLFYTKEREVNFIFAVFIFIEFLYSILFPSYYPSHRYWMSLEELNLYKKDYSLGSFDNLLIKKLEPFIANYRVNVDVGGYLLLAHDFPRQYFRGHLTFLTRPLYPFMVYLVARPLQLISTSYSMTFLAGLVLNGALFFITAMLFYRLVAQYVSPLVGFGASSLLILSPFAHIWLSQPETNIFGAFLVMLSLYLLSFYLHHPSQKNLVLFSLIIGTLLLGKKLFFISFFIISLALIFKRYREGIIFFFLHLIPFALWYLFVTFVWGLSFQVDEVSSFGVGVWLIDVFTKPCYYTMGKLSGALPEAITATMYGFIVIPLLFSLGGWPSLKMKYKKIIASTYCFSLFLLLFMAGRFIPRHAFLLFPLIYPSAVLGIERSVLFLTKRSIPVPALWYFLLYGSLIIPAHTNIYRFIPYG
ncbi:MAG: hypothetical protein HY001_02795 [Candidatus Portnoybacteria bacterium]|nr:hypothetical protein [Candidatus Portnoybacteria bacterium]